MPTASPTSTTQVSNNQYLGVALALLGAAFFATKGIVIKLAMLQNIDAVTTLTWAHDRRRADFRHCRNSGLSAQKRATGRRWPPVVDAPTVAKALGVGILGYYVASYLDFQL